ncbi:DUF262 domain-containing protein [Rhodococcus aetherivorans]|uniref:DUF262 domain-containing protein n=1 Tax=Rhodococcus aetherivorans TaxID=191292 RepID=A0AA46SG28_9NOCA|nr:DUF262 domain-containing protein [Rhodococcus aetherivorans]UYF96572.1 DUF262 domain-containing protein [Rhodococcus aetherivorans]
MNGRLMVNRRYQRKLVWTLDEKRELIQSIRKNYPIPSILVAEIPGNQYEIIDGLQRLFSIFSFIENAYSTKDELFFDIEEFPSAKSRSETKPFSDIGTGAKISRAEVVNIIGYNVPISILRGASDDEIDEVFRRINTYGRQLSDQDRRQSGVQDSFANMVRTLSSAFRGDSSSDLIGLDIMPSISIDLPKTNHGYGIQSDQTFWVKEGILRSTDLRDSEDEQCLSDIAACIVGGQLIRRSKDALDEIYNQGSPENNRMREALAFYGAEKFSEELHYCVEEIQKCCEAEGYTRMRNLLFETPSNNSFSAVFAAIVIAFHRVLIQRRRRISDYGAVKKALKNINRRIDTGRGSTTVAEREKNISAIVGLIEPSTVSDDLSSVYTNHSFIQIDERIQRSQIESSGYELKQGLLTLSPHNRGIDASIIDKVCKNICAIANNGPDQDGTIILGVADKEEDARRVESLDQILAKPVGKKYVVGLNREAKFLGISPEDYFSKWRNGIAGSALSDPLKKDVLSNISWNNYHGYGLIVIAVPKQKQLSFFGDAIYAREGDNLRSITGPKDIAGLAARFQ